jgi:peptide/nickel transport system substrate-binding protein
LRPRRSVPWFAALVVFALIAAACDDAGSGSDTSANAPISTAEPATTTAAPSTTAPTPTTTTPSTTAPPAGKPYGGEVVVGLAQEPPTLNPLAQGGDKLAVSAIGQGYFAGVQEIDGFTLDLVPELVTELPTEANGGVTVNEDGSMTVRYQIRDEARWSDGTPISGDDFQFTLDTIRDENLLIDTTTYEDIIATSVGPKTFECVFAEPTVLFELLFGIIIPKHVVEGTDFNNDWNDTMWPSAGPFVFDSWQEGGFVKLVRNDNYWKTDAETGQQLPYLDSVVFRFAPDSESLVSDFKGRQIDVINPPSAEIQALQALEPEGVRVEVVNGIFWEHLNFQFGPGRLTRNPDSANANLNYRKAVAHAIDKNLIVEVLDVAGEPLDSLIEQYSPDLSQGSWDQYDYNVDKAKEYAEAAKAELGVDELVAIFSTTSNVDDRTRVSELLVQMFADVGITYESQLEISQVFFDETYHSGEWDMGEWAWVGAPGFSGLIVGLSVFDPDASPPDGANKYRWGTEDSSVIDDNTRRFAEIYDALNTSIDPGVLEPLVKEAEDILANQVVIIPLYARLDPGVVWADTVGGFRHNPTRASFTWNVEEWYHLSL